MKSYSNYSKSTGSETQSIFSILLEAVVMEASDVFISVDEPPTLKIYGSFTKLSQQHVELSTIDNFLRVALPPNKLIQFNEGHDVDCGYEMRGVSRFRLNVFRHLKGVSLAIRPLPEAIPALETLGLPQSFQDLIHLRQGLILVTGAAGTGKTTTLAAFINAINQRYQRHIITIEDPIEYIIPNDRSLIHQREIGWHTTSFAEGLRSGLRENPDIIVVGELRDLESISLALTAAETGHLVLGTLHSGSATQALTRLIDVFDSVRQPQILTQLAQSLQCVCSQRLFKAADRKGMVVATEILLVSLAMGNIIRQNRIHEMRGFMETGTAEHMHTFKQSIGALIRSGAIKKEETSAVSDLLNTKLGY